MKYPIHKNLNTSFVNLAALVRYLRTLQFVGTIHIELSSYEADIEFTASNTMRACEHDHIAGRISHGEHALQRILIRAKEPGGLVHVYQNTPLESGQKIYIDESIVAGANRMVSSTGDTPVRNFGGGKGRTQTSAYSCDQSICGFAGQRGEFRRPRKLDRDSKPNFRIAENSGRIAGEIEHSLSGCLQKCVRINFE